MSVKAQATEQEKTLSNGVYGAAVIKPTFINGEFSILSGAKIVWVYQGSFSIGASMYNILTRNQYALYVDSVTGKNPSLKFDYFGLDWEYFLLKTEHFKYSFCILFGSGRAEYYVQAKKNGDYFYSNYGYDWFYILEPGANLTLKITEWMESCFGISYRYLVDSDYNVFGKHFANADFGGITLSLMLKLGSF